MIDEDIKQAILNGDTLKRDVLRVLNSEIKLKEKENKKPLSDINDIVKRLVKQYSEMAEDYSKSNNQEQYDKTIKELRILEEYLPKYLSESETRNFISQIILSIENPTQKDMGRIMLSLKSNSNIDLSVASKIVKEMLCS